MAAEGATAFGPVASPYGCNSWAIASSSAAVLRSSFLPSARHRGRRSVAKPSSCRSRSRGWRVTAVAGAQGLAEYLVKGAVELTAEGGPGWGSASMLLPALLWYTTAAPGSVSGLLDFLRAPVHARMQPTFSPEEVELGRQLGEGSFGVVFEGYVRKKGSKRDERLHVVLKKAKAKVEGALEVHDVEIHMNHRVKRTAPGACADFLGTLEVPASHVKGRMTEGLWLVWRFQGDKTLDQCMKHWNFPDNIAEAILGVRAVSERGFSKEETLEFETAVVKKVMCQILSNLRDLHSAGVVHRDVKPLNLVLDQRRGSFTLIDLGACVDLRSGYNYDPQESILDPTYAAPEQFVMPTCTPALPPDPLCSLISPLVWMLNSPDRFDLYSTGIILMQLCVKSLRYEPGLLAFNRYLERANYDLDLWRKRARISDTEFAILDADDGAGWELARALLQARHHKESVIWPSLGSGRPSAAGALKHRFLRESRFPFPLPRVPTDVLENLGSLLPDSREVKPDLGGAVFSAIATAAPTTAAPTSEHGEKGSTHRGLENLLGDAVLAANRLSRGNAGGESKSSIPVSNKGKGDDVQQGGAESRFPFPLPKVPTDVLGNLGSLLPDSREVKPDLGGAVFSAIATAAPTSEHGEKGSSHRGLENLLGDAVLAANRLSRSNAGGDSISSIPVSHKGKGDDVQQDGAVFVERKSRSQPIGIPSLTQGSVSVNLAGAQAALATEGMAERAVQGAKTVSRQLAELGTRQKEVSEAVANIIGPLGPAVSASLPAAAALAAGWVAWIGLRTSSQMTYELGQRAADTVGMSGTAFLAFFFLFKPWLAEVAAAEREETSRRRKADVAMAAVGHSTTLQKILVKREEQTAAFQSLGLDEAVEAMQKQMASLEANLASGLEYSRQQSQAVSRLQSLLH